LLCLVVSPVFFILLAFDSLEFIFGCADWPIKAIHTSPTLVRVKRILKVAPEEGVPISDKWFGVRVCAPRLHTVAREC